MKRHTILGRRLASAGERPGGKRPEGQVDGPDRKRFLALIIDDNTATVAEVEEIMDAGDLTAVPAQEATMERPRRSRADATSEAAPAKTGYRAASATASSASDRSPR